MMEATEYRPDFVTPPGETLQETLDALHMTQADVAARMGRPIKTINEIIKGKASITPATALQLERVTAVPAAFWNAREARYREHLAAEEERARLARQDEWLRRVPVAAMTRLGWIPRGKSTVEKSRNVLTFFGVADPSVLMKRIQEVQYRQSPAFDLNPFAIAAWLQRGMIEARSIDCAPYDPNRFLAVLNEARSMTRSPDPDFDEHLTALCGTAGVALVFVPELPKTRTWGATRWISRSRALIQMSLRYRTDDHFWFTFFHEAAHVLRHGKREVFIDRDGSDAAEDTDANRFAADVLIPPDRYAEYLQTRWRSRAAIGRLASSIGVSSGIVVGRLQHDGHLPYNCFNDLKVELRWRT